MDFGASLVEAPLATTLARPEARVVFELFGLAPDPGRDGTLGSLCRRAGLDPYLVGASLEALGAKPPPELELDWNAEPLERHLDHLVRHHHVYLRRALPVLGQLLDRLCRADPSLQPLRRRFEAFWQAVAIHLDAEEMLVFAPLERLVQAPDPADARTVASTLARMAVEHGTADGHLAALGALARALPPAGPGQQVLQVTLGWLAADMARHIAEEDHGLFVRARLLAAATLR